VHRLLRRAVLRLHFTKRQLVIVVRLLRVVVRADFVHPEFDRITGGVLYSVK